MPSLRPTNRSKPQLQLLDYTTRLSNRHCLRLFQLQSRIRYQWKPWPTLSRIWGQRHNRTLARPDIIEQRPARQRGHRRQSPRPCKLPDRRNHRNIPGRPRMEQLCHPPIRRLTNNPDHVHIRIHPDRKLYRDTLRDKRRTSSFNHHRNQSIRLYPCSIRSRSRPHRNQLSIDNYNRLN